MYRYLVWAVFATTPILAGSTLQTDEDSNFDFVLPKFISVAESNGDNWKCRDGSYISMESRCDGVLDCNDLSDETHALCWKQSCPSTRFRCTYGACVDITAPCNGVVDCADGSDEQLPICRNQTLVVNGKFRCSNGDEIFAEYLCDGTKNCADGSDETLSSCAAQSCRSQQFQCAYGACVDSQSECQENRKQEQDCADGSDDTGELCNRITEPAPLKCVVPPPPEHGSYAIAGQDAQPGQEFDSITLTVNCPPTFRPDGTVEVSCVDGVWSDLFPECKQFCRLPRHHSVTYFCGDRECNEFEPSGTEARPVCKNKYENYATQHMKCVSDQWSYIGTCQLKYWIVTEGNNLTLYIGENIAVHISGSRYTVSLEDAHETISTMSMPITSDGPNEIVSDANVMQTSGATDVVSEPTPQPVIKRPSSHFNSKYTKPRH